MPNFKAHVQIYESARLTETCVGDPCIGYVGDGLYLWWLNDDNKLTIRAIDIEEDGARLLNVAFNAWYLMYSVFSLLFMFALSSLVIFNINPINCGNVNFSFRKITANYTQQT